MSILQPTCGELADRACVLAIKVPAFQARSLNCHHLEAEMHAIQTELAKRNFAGHRLLSQELLAAHQGLWDLTERMAQVSDVSDANAREVAAIGLRLFQLNRRRAELKEALDRDAQEWAGREKLL